MTTPAQRLLDEHHLCDKLLWDCYSALVDRDPERARGLYGQLKSLVLEHMVLEDEHLFPPLAAQGALMADYVEKMLTEHAQLRELMAELETAMAGPIDDRTLFLAERLLRNLRGHTQKEELVVLPALEAGAGAARP